MYIFLSYIINFLIFLHYFDLRMQIYTFQGRIKCKSGGFLKIFCHVCAYNLYIILTKHAIFYKIKLWKTSDFTYAN